MNEKLQILVIGANGAIATTLYAGIFAAAADIYPAVGLLTSLPEHEAIPFASLESINFAGWDLRSGSPSDWVKRHGIVPAIVAERVDGSLRAIPVKEAPQYRVPSTIARMAGLNPDTPAQVALQVVERLRSDIRDFKALDSVCSRQLAIVVNSTEPPTDVALGPFGTLEEFESALGRDDPRITLNTLYAYSLLREGVGIINFTPNTVFETPAHVELAQRSGIPLSGRDGKTGQTLYKTVLGSMFRHRNLEILGWFSTNILGGGDGLALGDPEHLRAKIQTKSGVLDSIVGYEVPNHLVHIHNYPLRGDRKESWDVIDFKGWLGAPMSMRIDWQGQDSALAASLLTDLIRLVDLLWRNGRSDQTSRLAAYYKDPLGTSVHDFFEQVHDLRTLLSEQSWA